jgi:phosphatidate cytidylyltransferase
MSEAQPPKKGPSNLTLRLATAAVGIPIILWMLYWAPPWVFSATSPIFAALGAYELSGMVVKKSRPLQFWLIAVTMIVTGVLVFLPSGEALLTLMFGVVMSGALMVLAFPDPMSEASGRMGWLIAGPFYVGGAIAAIAKLHHLDNGGTWVVLSMALAWGSDTGGYFAGRALGKHKLYEKISPKKTIEGSIGGLAAVVAFAVAIKLLWLHELSWIHAIVLALVAGAIGQAGDLCVSVVKRSTGVKDTGNIIPGHGGLLDRIDALMFTAPVSLLYAHWVLDIDGRVPALPFLSS